jgi:hypothetical protein
MPFIKGTHSNPRSVHVGTEVELLVQQFYLRFCSQFSPHLLLTKSLKIEMYINIILLLLFMGINLGSLPEGRTLFETSCPYIFTIFVS